MGSVQAFKQPDEWKTYRSKLTGVEKGSTYAAMMDGGIGRKAVSGKLSFGADQLQTLGKGEVLASDGDGGAAVMGRDDFLKAVDSRCQELAS